MNATVLARALRAGVIASALMACALPALAQQPKQTQPSANAILLAREIINAKGANKMYEPVIVEVVDRTKSVLLQTNPMLVRELNDVATQLKAEYAPRVAEILNEVAKMYAARFSEAELKEVLAFYKSAVGQKTIVQEPQILDQSVAFAESWADKFSQEVAARIRAEMKKKGHDL
jgi:uncharacterized protein